MKKLNTEKVNRTVDFATLHTELCECKTKHQLVDTFNRHGLRTTTQPTDTPNTNDLYIQFFDKSRVLIGKKSLKFYTNDETSKNTVFKSLVFDKVNDGSYRTKRATVPNTIDNFKLIVEYFLTDDNAWLPTTK